MSFDAYFDDVTLLLHCDGTNGSTTFTDSSPTPNLPSADGATVSTAQSVFGGASALFRDGQTDSIYVADSSDFQFDSGDFTVEAWVRSSSTTSDKFIFSRWDAENSARSWALLIGSAGTFEFRLSTTGNTTALTSNTGVTATGGQWFHVALTRSGTTVRTFVDGVLTTTNTLSGALYAGSAPVLLGRAADFSGFFNGHVDDVRVTKGVARYTATFTPPAEAFPDEGPPPDPLAIVAAPGPLGAPAVLVDVLLVTADIAAPSPLQSPAVFAALVTLAHGSAASPLAAPAIAAYHDFTGQLGDATTLFVMDLDTPGGTVRLPISSWQATLQTGSSNYVQCVVPACSDWVDTINAATEFVIYRRAVLADGSAIEYEMARAPAQTLQFDLSPARYTCTMSGYTDAFAASEDPPAVYDRALTGIRSISSGSSYRVRCAVDWLLRPGHRAYADGAPFVVAYINYYAPSGFDCYMDAGS